MVTRGTVTLKSMLQIISTLVPSEPAEMGVTPAVWNGQHLASSTDTQKWVGRRPRPQQESRLFTRCYLKPASPELYPLCQLLSSLPM